MDSVMWTGSWTILMWLHVPMHGHLLCSFSSYQHAWREVLLIFFRRLPEGDCDTVAKLKKALRREYDVQALETDYALLFAARKRQPGESMVEYSEALRNMGRRAYPTFSDKQLEILCRSHFINGVDEAIRVQLLVGEPEEESYRQLVRRARQLEQVMAPTVLRRVQNCASEDGTNVYMEMKKDIEKLTAVVGISGEYPGSY